MNKPQTSGIDKNLLAEIAIQPEGQGRSASYILNDHENLCASSLVDGLELLPIAEALDKYPWVRENYFHEPETLKNKGARLEGFFLRVKRGTRIQLPSQAAICMSGTIGQQRVHNIIILEEASSLEFIAGCASAQSLIEGEHEATTETYIGKGASFTSTMVHRWGLGVRVLPHDTTTIEEGGRYVNNYVTLSPAGFIESNPLTYLNGPGASAKFSSVIFGRAGSSAFLGGDIHLNAEGTSAELNHRAVCAGGKVIQRGLLIGRKKCQAHVDCAGMLIDAGEEGYIESVPGLRSYHADARMSHEASIGKIAPRQVQYLMAQGLDEREAISMIVRGFLDNDIKGLGEELDKMINEITELAGHSEE